MTHFVVDGPAATKGSTVSFMSKRGLVTKADCKALKPWSEAVGWAAKAAGARLLPLQVPVRVEAVFQFPWPSADRAQPTVRPDVDKLLRALLDALTGVAFIDDGQVVSVVARKIYGEDARTTVSVSEAA